MRFEFTLYTHVVWSWYPRFLFARGFKRDGRVAVWTAAVRLFGLAISLTRFGA